MADGSCDLLAVADRAQLPFAVVLRAADLLVEHKLLERCG
jgi:hypothetical protein